MSHLRELVLDEDKEKLDFLNSQKKNVGKTSRVVTMMGDQNFILIESEEAVSQEDWLGGKEEESNEDEGEIYLSHGKEKSVLELKEDELIIRISQGVEGKQWNVVKKEEKKSYIEIEEHQLDIAEGNDYNSIKEVREATISGETFGEIPREKGEIKARKVEENNQQFRDEWIKCSVIVKKTKFVCSNRLNYNKP
jgi:hypothetical protein